MHIHILSDPKTGDTTDVIPFCCDNCHADWCHDNGVKYDGWFGCQEGGDSQEFCAQCGVYCGGGTGENAPCECQTSNIVVNRFLSTEGRKCECGNWLQVPSANLEHLKLKPSTT